MAIKKIRQIGPPLLFLLDPGSESGIRDLGSRINIPQHCSSVSRILYVLGIRRLIHNHHYLLPTTVFRSYSTFILSHGKFLRCVRRKAAQLDCISKKTRWQNRKILKWEHKNFLNCLPHCNDQNLMVPIILFFEKLTTFAIYLHCMGKFVQWYFELPN